jgi:hypothetical protein
MGDGPPKSSMQALDYVSEGKTARMPLRTEEVHGGTSSDLP